MTCCCSVCPLWLGPPWTCWWHQAYFWDQLFITTIIGCAQRVQCSRAVWSLTSRVALCICKNTVCSFLQHACANCENSTQPTICTLSQPHPGWLCAPFNTLCAASCNNCNILKYKLCNLCAATYLQVKWQSRRPKNGSGQPKDALFMQSKAMISPPYCIRNCNPQKNVIQYSQT